MEPAAPSHPLVVIGASFGGVEALIPLVTGLPRGLPGVRRRRAAHRVPAQRVAGTAVARGVAEGRAPAQRRAAAPGPDLRGTAGPAPAGDTGIGAAQSRHAREPYAAGHRPAVPHRGAPLGPQGHRRGARRRAGRRHRRPGGHQALWRLHGGAACAWTGGAGATRRDSSGAMAGSSTQWSTSTRGAARSAAARAIGLRRSRTHGQPGRPLRYRCHTGHAYTVKSLECPGRADRPALQASFRALKEREQLLRRMAGVSRSLGDDAQAEVGMFQAARVQEQAARLAELIAEGSGGA